MCHIVYVTSYVSHCGLWQVMIWMLAVVWCMCASGFWLLYCSLSSYLCCLAATYVATSTNFWLAVTLQHSKGRPSIGWESGRSLGYVTLKDSNFWLSVTLTEQMYSKSKTKVLHITRGSWHCYQTNLFSFQRVGQENSTTRHGSEETIWFCLSRHLSGVSDYYERTIKAQVIFWELV